MDNCTDNLKRDRANYICKLPLDRTVLEEQSTYKNNHIKMKCLACHLEMRYLKEFKFDSQDNNRGLLGSLFDIEERLIFDIFVCPSCKRTEFIYKASDNWIDGD